MHVIIVVNQRRERAYAIGPFDTEEGALEAQETVLERVGRDPLIAVGITEFLSVEAFFKVDYQEAMSWLS
jgi:hypothetical protein